MRLLSRIWHGRLVVTAAIVLAAMWAGSVAQHTLDYMPLAEVRPGMEGVGRTVVAGTAIETFTVRIVDVVDVPGSGDFILARVSGGAIAHSGGVASGMSGSPVYIDNRLVGGLRATALWQTSDDPLVWLTPAEEMRALVGRLATSRPAESEPVVDGPPAAPDLDGSKSEQQASPLPSEQGAGVIVPVRSMSGQISQVHFIHRSPSAEDIAADPFSAYFLDLCSAPTAGGLAERSMTWLQNGVPLELLEAHRPQLLPNTGPDSLLSGFLNAASRGIGAVVEGASAEVSGSDGVLEPQQTAFAPGAPMGALLLGGDAYYGWLGTVTLTDTVTVDGALRNVVVGMAHPVLNTGESDYFLNPISILDTVQGADSSWKVGVPIGLPEAPVLAGVVAQDTNAGIAAIVGELPRAIRLNITVEDMDRLDAIDTYAIDVAPMRDLYPLLLLIAGYNAVYKTLGRVGPGTMWLDCTIQGEGLPRDIHREDVFVANDDVGLLGPLQVARIAYLLAWNEFADVRIDRIDMAVRVTSRIEAVTVEVVETEERICAPGDTIHYVVGLRSHEAGTRTHRGTFTVPMTFREGPLSILAAPEAYLEEVIAYSQHGWVRPMSDVWTFDHLIEEIETAAKGDTLWVFFPELGCPYIDCSDEQARGGVLKVLALSDLDLRGAVTGFDTSRILVLPGAAP